MTEAAQPPRLAWLDALRGYAALVVVCFHLSPLLIGNDRHLAVYAHVDFGKYGVLLFFLVSGYVIPMSLERHGSLRRFWIGRLCRIYPAYLAAVALFAVLALAGWTAWPPQQRAESLTSVLAHASMLGDTLGLRGVLRVDWTLSYEMIFYLVVSGLFVWGLHRHSAWWAAMLAGAALFAGGVLPDDLFGATPGARRLTAAALLLFLALSILAYVKNRHLPAAGAAGLALVLLPALNGAATDKSVVLGSWQGLLLLAVMFAGTVVYRVQHRQIGRAPASAALIAVALGVVGAHWTQLGTTAALRLWLANTAAVAVTFAIGYALRNRPVPAMLTWLGRISYSLYLTHLIVLLALLHVIPDFGKLAPVTRLATGLAYLVAAFAVSWLSYRIVEQPGQRLGRRLTARLERTPISTTQRAAPRTGRGQNERQSV